MFDIAWIRFCVWGNPSFMRMSDIVQYTSVTTLACAIFLLLFFRKLHIYAFQSIAKFLAPLAFSVYLIHTHPLIYTQFFDENMDWLPHYPLLLELPCLLICLGVFVSCLFLDIPRHWLFTRIRRFIARKTIGTTKTLS